MPKPKSPAAQLRLACRLIIANALMLRGLALRHERERVALDRVVTRSVRLARLLDCDIPRQLGEVR